MQVAANGAVGLEDVIVRPLTGAAPTLDATILAGSSGATRWTLDGIDVSKIVAVHSDVELDGTSGRDIQVVSLDKDACESVTVEARRGSDGARHATGSLGQTLELGDTAAVTLSLPSEVNDITGDGFTDVVVENESWQDTRSIHLLSAVSRSDGRDQTPGVERHGWVSLVDGRTQAELLRLAKPLDGGPGPIAGFTSDAQGTLLVAALGATQSASGDFTTSVVAKRWTGSGFVEAWQKSVPLLAGGDAFFDLARGPAFITTNFATADPQRSGVFVPVQPERRITVLDRRTGSIAWTTSVVGTTAGLQALGGDLVILDSATSTVTLLSGADGHVVWSVTLPQNIATSIDGTNQPAGDQDADGAPDYLLNAFPAPAVLSGRTGSIQPEIEAAVVRNALYPVRDLDGDGSDDLVGVVGTPHSEGSSMSIAVAAIEGRTGALLWTAPLPPAIGNAAVFATSGHLTQTALRDVIVYRQGIDVSAFDASSGSLLWTRAAPETSHLPGRSTNELVHGRLRHGSSR